MTFFENLFGEKLTALAMGLFFFASVPATASDKELPEKIDFNVVDLASGKEIYTGSELIKLEGETIIKDTSYLTLDKKLAQFEKVVYDRPSLALISYTLDNKITGENAVVKFNAGKFDIAYKAPRDPANPADTTTQATQANLASAKDRYLGKVLHHLIVRNWETLVASNPLAFDLIVPFKAEFYRFQVAKQKVEAGLTVFRLQPDSWLIRKFVQPMDFFYSAAPEKRLVRYIGPTTINGKANDESKVQINFSYGQ